MKPEQRKHFEFVRDEMHGDPVETVILDRGCAERGCMAHNHLVDTDGVVFQKKTEEIVQWGVEWGRAGDAPCVSIIKRLPDGGIEVVAVEYGPVFSPQRKQWVGLTPEDFKNVAAVSDAFEAGAYWADNKLKEKNA